jgi:ATP-binding cassette, subfamily B, bacterial
MGRLVRGYLLTQWPRMALLGTLGVTSISLDVFNPQVMRHFVDGALAAAALPALLSLGGLYLGIAIASQLVSVAEAYVAEVAAWTATNELRADLTAHLLRLDLAFFHWHPSGELIDRVDGDVSRLASFLGDMAVIVIGNVLLVAGIVVALFLQDWLAGLAFALFCLVTILWLRPLVGRAVPRLTARRQAEAELMGFLEERLGWSPRTSRSSMRQSATT